MTVEFYLSTKCVLWKKKDVIWRTLFKFGKWKFTSYTLWIIVLKTKSKVIQINGFIYSGTPCIKIYLKLYFFIQRTVKDVSILYFWFYLLYHACIAFLVEFVLRIRLQLTKLERVAAPAPYITQVIFLKVACWTFHLHPILNVFWVVYNIGCLEKCGCWWNKL